MGQEVLRRAVGDRAAQGILAAHLHDQLLVHQGLEGVVALHAAHLLHLCAGDRLLVGHHGKGLHRCLGQGLLLHRLQEMHHVLRVERAGGQLHLMSEALEGEAPLVEVVLIA